MAGGAHPGIPLSSVDMDHRALGRHAAGVLARRGCRRAVLFLGPTRQMGDAECEAGLAEAGSPLVHSVYRAIRQRLAGAVPRATRLMPEFREG